MKPEGSSPSHVTAHWTNMYTPQTAALYWRACNSGALYMERTHRKLVSHFPYRCVMAV